MDNELAAFETIFTEVYYFLTIVIMWLIHVGFTLYETGVSRRKNMLHTLMKNLMLIPVISFAFFFFGWWAYFAFAEVPFGPFVDAPWALPWSNLMGANFGAVGDPDGWARINGVFAMAFALFAWTTGSICSGAVIERIRLGAFLVLIAIFGGFLWLIDAAWGWNASGWMVQLMGYHDTYAAGVVHAAAGGFALGVLIVLGPRIGKFGPNGEIRDIKPHNKWLTCVGILTILTGFWGFMAACHVPFVEITGDPEQPFFTATSIFGTPLTLSQMTINYILAVSSGMLAMFFMSRGEPFWTMSGMLTGVISVASGMDYYYPLQLAGLAFAGSVIAYKLHHWVERRFHIDDAVGAVAVHGYCGVFSLVAAGFVLWGYPAVAPIGDGQAWFGTNADGWPVIQPLGQIIGAVIMFAGFGLIPGLVLAYGMNALGLLRYPREVELAGQDTHYLGDAYPYFATAETEFEGLERKHVEEELGR